MNGYKTIIASIVSMIATASAMFGVDLGDQTALVEGITAIVAAGAAIWFRITATKDLKSGGALK